MPIVVSHRIRQKEFGAKIPKADTIALLRTARVALATPIAAKGLPAKTTLSVSLRWGDLALSYVAWFFRVFSVFRGQPPCRRRNFARLWIDFAVKKSGVQQATRKAPGVFAL